MRKKKFIDVLELIDSLNIENKRNVLIFGSGSSGKTYLANKICEFYQISVENILNTDDYIIDSTIRNKIKDSSISSVYSKSSHFTASLNRDVRMMLNRDEFLKLENYKGESNKFKAPSTDTCILEGIGSIFTKEYTQFDLRIYIYTDREQELKYRIKRDVEERGISKDIVIKKFDIRRKQFENYHKEYIELADIVIKNNFNEFIIERNIYNK